MNRWRVTHFDAARHRHQLVVLACNAVAAIELAEAIYGVARTACAVRLHRGCW